VLDDADIGRYAATWRTEGWVLVENLIPADVIDAAAGELGRLYPPPEVFHAGSDDPRTRAFLARRDPDLVFGDPPVTGPGFRPDQFLGIRELPFPDAPRLNALTLHPELLRFVRAALGADDVRLYQALLWPKYTGVTDYEQPLHRDDNHSLVPPRSEPGWWQTEGFVYLNDVGSVADAPTRLVSVRHTGRVRDRPGGTDRQVAATGPRGSFLAYRPDVWHRGTDLTAPGGARVVLATAFKLAGAEWIGYSPIARRAPDHWFQELVAGSTPDQLTVLGIPAPGHPYWTADVVAELAVMYPGLDTGPWLAALD
jgi:hypothetical protein